MSDDPDDVSNDPVTVSDDPDTVSDGTDSVFDDADSLLMYEFVRSTYGMDLPSLVYGQIGLMGRQRRSC